MKDVMEQLEQQRDEVDELYSFQRFGIETPPMPPRSASLLLPRRVNDSMAVYRD